VPYLAAFDAIDADPNQLLAVIKVDGHVAGTLQLTFIAGLSRRGATRATIEAVRVHRDHRKGGLGTAMLEWAIEQARDRGCTMVQLTADTARVDAHRFYQHLGFEPSHIGFKMTL
ncbi:MAG TPA: GNAT family N-acetyltransferase, partial [Thermomicrobiales bacterium]|nr:GNAT family N-acetyltransferase [Thermomicrobiales bacterium]